MQEGYSISEWLSQMRAGNPNINPAEIIAHDSQRYERLRLLHGEFNIPIQDVLTVDGEYFDSSQEAKRFFDAHKGSRFLIRASPRTGNLPHHRKIDVTEKETADFVARLERNLYEFNLAVYHPVEEGCVIISNGKMVVAELVRGDIRDIVQGRQTPNLHATIAEGPGIRFKGDESYKSLLLRGLGYVSWQGRINSLTVMPQDIIPGYFEFIHNGNDGIIFVDYNTSDFFTKL